MLRGMLTVERLRADHAPALLDFERENRAYFARSVSDRGEAYFAEFADRHRALLAEQEAGLLHLHVVLDGDGALVGRVNLVCDRPGAPELGYRIARRAAGRGVATAAVAEVCRLAGAVYGLTELQAFTTADNHASRTVLERNAFTHVGEATLPRTDRPGLRYHRTLP